jgi:hypothetical protein
LLAETFPAFLSSRGRITGDSHVKQGETAGKRSKHDPAVRRKAARFMNKNPKSGNVFTS